MFKLLKDTEIGEFRAIYHQTTPYSNPIIDSVVFDTDNKGYGHIFYWGDLREGNYLIMHRSGFTTITFNQFVSYDVEFYKQLDRFISTDENIRHYLMFFNVPVGFLEYLKDQDKDYFQIRTRIKYQIDEDNFKRLDEKYYQFPEGYYLKYIDECPISNLEIFNLELETKYYNSWDDFLTNSFGLILYDENDIPTSIAYTICTVGRNAEIDLLTLPEFRKKGLGNPLITHHVRECHNRHLDASWDCFESNHTNKTVQRYGYTHIIRKYDFVTYLNRPNP